MQETQQHIAELEAQKSRIDAVDAFGFASTAAVAGLVLRDLTKTLQNSANIESRANIASKIIDAKSSGRLEEMLNNIFGKHENNEKIITILSNGINEESFANLTSLLSKDGSKAYNNNFLNSISEHFPGGMSGAIVTAAALVGLAVAVSSKAHHNQMTDFQIAALQQQSIPTNTIKDIQMDQFRKTIEETPLIGEQKSR